MNGAFICTSYTMNIYCSHLFVDAIFLSFAALFCINLCLFIFFVRYFLVGLCWYWCENILLILLELFIEIQIPIQMGKWHCGNMSTKIFDIAFTPSTRHNSLFLLLFRWSVVALCIIGNGVKTMSVKWKKNCKDVKRIIHAVGRQNNNHFSPRCCLQFFPPNYSNENLRKGLKIKPFFLHLKF